MTKTYQSLIYVTYTTCLIINGKKQYKTFDGGRQIPGKDIKGTYITSDPEVQKAIESDPGYGKQFILINEVTDTPDKPVKTFKTPEPQAIDPPVVDPPAEDLPEDINPETEGNEPTTADEVTSSAGAKKYLNETFNVPYSKLANIDLVLKVAEEKNVTFPNWTAQK